MAPSISTSIGMRLFGCVLKTYVNQHIRPGASQVELLRIRLKKKEHK